MARPVKSGLEYFPFDVDFFSDEKMYAISGEFGIKGEITTIKLLCAIYRNGYFIEWTEMLKYKLLKELPGVSIDLLEQIIRRLIKWDFFDKGLFDSASILTSRGIQRRYQAICAKMHRKGMELTEYCLLDNQPQGKSAKVAKKSSAAKKHKLAEPVIESTFKPKPKPVSLDESIAAMLADDIWSEPVCMRYGINPEEFKQKVANFKLHCLSREKREHADIADAKRHFCNLLSQGKLDSITSPANDITPAEYSFKGGFGGKDT